MEHEDRVFFGDFLTSQGEMHPFDVVLYTARNARIAVQVLIFQTMVSVVRELPRKRVSRLELF